MDAYIQNKLNNIELRLSELDSNFAAGNSTVDKLKEYTKLSEIMNINSEYSLSKKELLETKKLFSESDDKEFKQMCEDEITQLSNKINFLEFKLIDSLVEKDPDDECNAIVEISGEVGGEEANLFARDLFEMYSRFANSSNFEVDVLSSDETDLGGFNNIVFKINGNNAYGTFKYESGIHRVQRVPETEAKGRLHTSTASVMVTPEITAEQFKLDLNDVEITTCHASGAGGQHINKTSSAIRAIYKPTGLTVFCQSRRSQLQNKNEAINLIASKLKADKIEAEAKAQSSNKASKLGNRDRSEKIRTYNFPQNRLTDHRINYTSLKLDRILQGDMNDLITSLQIEARNEKE